MHPDTETMPTCTTRDAARRLGISIRTAQLWVEEGRLRAWKTPGGHRRILKESVEQLLEEQRQASSAPSSRFSVLVLREDPDAREATRLLLAEVLPDSQVCITGNGFDALIRIGAGTPDVMISDLGLTGIDFFRMVSILTTQARTRSMLLIVLVASDADRIGVRARLPGDVVILTTPVDGEELATLVRAFRRQWMIQRSPMNNRVEDAR